jgi:excisionase family DNA binding protein
MERLLTPKQIAEKLGVAVSTIYQWTHTEFIPHIKVGRFVRFRESDIEKWLNSRVHKGRSTYRIPVDDILKSNVGKRRTCG